MTFETEVERKTRIHKARVKAQALAIIRRGQKAGIPQRYLRIGEDSFKALLNEEYHLGKDGIKDITNFIYHKANDLSKIPIIIIDGGKTEARKMAGFAILFRLIACDNFGLYKDCADIVHKMQTFVAEEGISRNDFTNSLKEQDVVFVSEFSEPLFSKHLEGGSYFDEFLSYRIDNLKPTIISFSEPINNHNEINTVTCGRYIVRFSQCEYVDDKNRALNPSDYMLRIRVKL